MNLDTFDPYHAVIEFGFQSHHSGDTIRRIEAKVRQHVRNFIDLSINRSSKIYACMMTFDLPEREAYFLIMISDEPEYGKRIDALEADPVLSKVEVEQKYETWMEIMEFESASMIDPEGN